jgi:putative spermidine/putrescine transport system permease protein
LDPTAHARPLGAAVASPDQEGRRRHADRSRRGPFDGRGTLWLLAIPCAFVALFLVVPLATIFTTALSDGSAHATSTIGDSLFLESVRRTFLLAAVVTAICLVLGVLYSFAIAVAGTRLRIVLLGALFVTFWISLLVRTYGWILLFQPNGVLDDVLHDAGLLNGPLNLLQTTPAMFPAMVHIMLPLMVLPVLGSLRAIDPRQLRAARSLGATPLTTIRRVILPQMRSGIVAGSVLVFVMSLGFYVTPAFLGGPGDLTASTIINLEFNELFDFSAASAMGAALLLVVLVLYFLADRLFGVSSEWEGAS